MLRRAAAVLSNSHQLRFALQEYQEGSDDDFKLIGSISTLRKKHRRRDGVDNHIAGLAPFR